VYGREDFLMKTYENIKNMTDVKNAYANMARGSFLARKGLEEFMSYIGDVKIAVWTLEKLPECYFQTPLSLWIIKH
jgi:hypothetical protein